MARQYNFLSAKNQLLSSIDFNSGLLFKYDRNKANDIVYETRLDSMSNYPYLGNIQQIHKFIKKYDFDLLDLSGVNLSKINCLYDLKKYKIVCILNVLAKNLPLNFRLISWGIDDSVFFEMMSYALSRDIKYWSLTDDKFLCYLP